MQDAEVRDFPVLHLKREFLLDLITLSKSLSSRGNTASWEHTIPSPTADAAAQPTTALGWMISWGASEPRTKRKDKEEQKKTGIFTSPAL